MERLVYVPGIEVLGGREYSRAGFAFSLEEAL